MPRKSRPPSTFENNVIINCPFDEAYGPIFDAIVFAVHDMGFRPRCALEASDAGQIRLDKIAKRYEQFRRDLPALCVKLKWDTKRLPFADFSLAIAIWIKANPL